MRRILGVLAALVAAGCVTPPCDKPHPYQNARPQSTLRVPDDLSEPPLRSVAPEVASAPDVRRADGRCLEQPPVYVPPAKEDEQGSS